MAAKPLSRRGQFTVGILVVAAGLCVAAIAASFVGRPAGRFDPVVALITGLALALAGVILVVPERDARTRAWFGALMITAIAVLFDWILFGLAARQAVAALPGAALFNLMALWAWFRARRVRRNARA
jgi:hypothetical protein